MNARYRDERVAGSSLRDASVLRMGTMSRHVRSAIGAPIQVVLLADHCRFSVPRLFTRSDSWLLMVLGPLLVKKGHGMGEKAGLQLA